MAQTEYDHLLEYTLEKVRTLEALLMGVVMYDPSPQALRKSVLKYISSIDTNDMYQPLTDAELVVAKHARDDTFAKVFRGVPPETPDAQAQVT